MKIQCSCGVKYTFEVTPEMAQRPIRFVCQSCGLDASEFVNELIRKELAEAAVEAGSASTGDTEAAPASALPPREIAPPPPSLAQSNTHHLRISQPSPAAIAAAPAAPESLVPQPPSAPAPASRLRISASAPVESSPPPTEEAFPICSKHPPQRTTNHCVVCQKPICPKCMQMFGYVCSPFCSAKAEAQGIDVPVFAGKKSVAEAREWRKFGLIGFGIAALVLGLVGFWIWYAWFGVVPHAVYTIPFADRVRHGQSAITTNDQIVYVRGDTLARYDLKAQKEIWATQVIDPKKVDAEVQQEIKDSEEMERRLIASNPDYYAKGKPDETKLRQWLQDAAESSLKLYVNGENVWLETQGRLVRYDWASGQPGKEVALPGRLVLRGGELVTTDASDPGMRVITHFNLASGETQVERIGSPTPVLAAAATPKPAGGVAATRQRAAPQGGAGLPLVPGKDAGKPMDPARVAAEAQKLSLPAKIALPAVLSSSMHQERILEELDDDDLVELKQSGGVPGQQIASRFSFVSGQDGYMQFSVRLLERNIVTRQAMKDPPKKSALEGNVNASQSLEVANEILNEMQRSRGGATVEEDRSKYQVVVRCPDKKEVPDWTGEVVGKPALHPLKSVSVVAAGTTLTVLDRNNKKMWEATLTHEVPRGYQGFAELGFSGGMERYGAGPCVERGDTLFVFDAAVLTAFETATGNVRWRLPTVGVSGIYFDDKGMMYVNTTTASPESVKYSRQIDVTSSTSSVIMKIDPKTGKSLWVSDPGLAIDYISGKYIYDFQSADADDNEENPYSIGLEQKSHAWIRRIDPKNGHVMGERYIRRAPLDVQFNGNTIQVVFKKELQVLKCF